MVGSTFGTHFSSVQVMVLTVVASEGGKPVVVTTLVVGMVQGQSVMVKVVAPVTVMVLSLMVNSVAAGQKVVNLVTTVSTVFV